MHFVDLPFFDQGFIHTEDLDIEEYNVTWAIVRLVTRVIFLGHDTQELKKSLDY